MEKPTISSDNLREVIKNSLDDISDEAKEFWNEEKQISISKFLVSLLETKSLSEEIKEEDTFIKDVKDKLTKLKELCPYKAYIDLYLGNLYMMLSRLPQLDIRNVLCEFVYSLKYDVLYFKEPLRFKSEYTQDEILDEIINITYIQERGILFGKKLEELNKFDISKSKYSLSINGIIRCYVDRIKENGYHSLLLTYLQSKLIQPKDTLTSDEDFPLPKGSISFDDIMGVVDRFIEEYQLSAFENRLDVISSLLKEKHPALYQANLRQLRLYLSYRRGGVHRQAGCIIRKEIQTDFSPYFPKFLPFDELLDQMDSIIEDAKIFTSFTSKLDEVRSLLKNKDLDTYYNRISQIANYLSSGVEDADIFTEEVGKLLLKEMPTDLYLISPRCGIRSERFNKFLEIMDGLIEESKESKEYVNPLQQITEKYGDSLTSLITTDGQVDINKTIKLLQMFDISS